MNNKNEIVVRFGIWDFYDISHEQITRDLEVVPIKTYIKGEKMGINSSQVAKGNGWLCESPLGKYASFEDQMNSLLDLLEPKVDILKPLCEKYYCEFSCALFVYRDNDESTPWVHLNSRYNNFLKHLNIEFDIDLYCL